MVISVVRVFSFIYALPFLVVGILGFIPNVWPMMSKSITLSMLYIITGAWLMWIGCCNKIYIRYSLQVIGITYAAATLAGFFFRLFGTGANDWFQFIMMVPAIIAGFSKEDGA